MAKEGCRGCTGRSSGRQRGRGYGESVIYEMLAEGEQNARTGKEICSLLHITQRDLTAAVERERRDGQPICASTGAAPGYFLAADRSEMERYCKSLAHRAKEIRKTRKACLQTLDSLPQAEAAKGAQL